MDVPLEMGWRQLLFESWPVDPDTMNDHLPAGLEADEFDGSAWLSAVPFTNVAVRPKGLPAAAGVRLPELNLRTYVTHEGTAGVYFFSLDARGVAAVVGARLLHSLPYYYARISLAPREGRIDFESRRLHPGAPDAEYAARYWPTGEPFAATDDALAEFLLERYRLYAVGRDGSLRYTDVRHEPWTLYPADAEVRTDTLAAASGFERPDTEPVRYYAPGVDVVADPSRRV